MTDWLLEQTRGPAIDLTTMVAPSVEVETVLGFKLTITEDEDPADDDEILIYVLP